MRRSTLYTLICVAVLGTASVPGVRAQTATPAAALPDFTGIVQNNAAAVVHVEAKYTGERQRSQQRQAMPGQGDPDDPQAEILRRFFGMPGMPSPEEQKRTSVGSGFILSGDGYILTNNHVVDGADKVTVRLQDHRTLTAKVVGTDPTYDIAVLKVDAGGTLPAVSIGDSRSLKPGQWVLAIGSPFGFDYTVTQGIVSAVGRNLGEQDQAYTSFIQTDVPINRGNSGGPLFNLQGQVVGINSQIYSSTGNYSGVSFSIPIDVAMNAVQQIKTAGFVTRGQLGVMVGPLTDDIVKGLKLDSSNGAIVSQVTPGSGAEKAGLREGDIILRYNGQAITQGADLPPLVGMSKPGSNATVDILRQGKRQTVQVVVGEAPRDRKSAIENAAVSPARSGQAALGMSVQEPDADTRQQMGLKPGQGVEIGEVTGPAAAAAGLQQGDVILMVGQQRIAGVAAFRAATQGVKPGQTVLLLVRRGDQSSFIGLTVPDDK
ncbi:MAG: Do family serine endopeptidase [Rhodanobacter sp.]